MNKTEASLLIVDDNEVNLNLLSRRMLGLDGYTVSTAGGGRQALELIEEKTFDVVLLDLNMPEVSGRDVLMAVRQNYSLSELPIIMLTAEQDSKAAVDTLQLGANDYVVKPIDFKTLKARIDTQISLKRNEQAYLEIKENLEDLVTQRTMELDQANDALADERQRFEYLLSSSPVITYATNLDDINVCNYVSKNFYKVMGYKPEEMINNSEFWITHVHPEDKQNILDQLKHNLEQGGGKVEYRFLHNDGEYRWIHDQHRVIKKNEVATEIIGTWTDVTERHQLEEALTYKDSHDELTGLINRRQFENCLQYIIKDKSSDTMQHVLCYIDIDQFKVINETYGHIVGDELLRQLSEVLKNKLSQRDTLAYLGGDEFGVLLQNCTLDQSHRVLGIIQDALHEYRFIWEEKNHAITASIGVVPIDAHTNASDNILSLADSACFAAKEAGRDRVHICTVEDSAVGQRQQEMLWVERITRALDEDRFYLYYQPIVALNDEAQGAHYELLIRMKDEAGNLILPNSFLPAAERYNLSYKIDRWVIQTIFSWLEAYSDLLDSENCWGINLSGHSLADKDLLQFVLDEFDRKQIPPQMIYFEITETAAIANIENAKQLINTLKNYGCQFALDDFGCGLSSFSYLKNLPVDFIKIDGVFVKDMANDKIDFAMVKAINDVSQAMGKKTIAEFVENNDIIEKLKDIGVDYAQGYGIGKPMPLSEWWKNRTIQYPEGRQQKRTGGDRRRPAQGATGTL